uniref:RxLR effector protein n=1 Tax=Phytophthora fragariae TaxID=53985 RepID=A0A6A3EKU8_9STRA|nr:hypothetical protein PF009_g15920 [Phytophthora fragariae]
MHQSSYLCLTLALLEPAHGATLLLYLVVTAHQPGPILTEGRAASRTLVALPPTKTHVLYLREGPS